MMQSKIDPALTEQDLVVLNNLFADIKERQEESPSDKNANHSSEAGDDSTQAAIARLQALNDPESPDFEPTVFSSWDSKDIPAIVNEYAVKPYARWAAHIVRHPTDVVFLTHIILYLAVNIPSAIGLFYRFTYWHGVLHVLFTFWCTGPYTLMMHNHIHNNGVLTKQWAWFDLVFPYLTEPLFGHTWDSYYYHHIKHHHVEANGPDDLSTTIRYQRDDVWHFLHYVGRFVLFIWLELPLYFLRKNKPQLALRALVSELASYAFMAYMATAVNFRASVFVFLIPFALLRLGLMIGNWGQHALVDEVEPDSDFRSSITLVDVPSNRFCFNDGYHTAHHLNPRRHWRDQPVHFLQSKRAYSDGRALVFHNIDYLMMTLKLLQRDYPYLAQRLVPIGPEQMAMSQSEIAALLRTKTRQFSEEEIRAKFRSAAPAATHRDAVDKQSFWRRSTALLHSVYAPLAAVQPPSIAMAAGAKKSL